MPECPHCGESVSVGMMRCALCGRPLPAAIAGAGLRVPRAHAPSPDEESLREVARRRGIPPADRVLVRVGPRVVPRAGWWERLRGKDAPRGTLFHARQLLREQQIESGRELLRRITRHDPANLEAQVWMARELLRPPPRRKPSLTHLEVVERIAPDAGERFSLAVLGTWTRSLEVAGKSFLAALDAAPRTPLGHALLLEARLCMSDFSIQATYRPAGSRVGAMLRNPILMGAARLNDRAYEAALDCFENAVAQADAAADAYERQFDFRMTLPQREKLGHEFRFLGRLGMALLARDLGALHTARRLYQELMGAPRFEPKTWSAHLEALRTEEP